MFKDIKRGLYAKRMGGGSVNPNTGEFNFGVLEGYLIEDGKITDPVEGAMLIGSGAEILQKIDMVADNLERAQECADRFPDPFQLMSVSLRFEYPALL